MKTEHRPRVRDAPSRRRRPPIVVIAAALAITSAAFFGLRAADLLPDPSDDTAARTFLDRYVMDDGRVSRLDQGGDTVSEGQAYAMLLAVATGDEDTFRRVWAWARTNLQRDDGLLSWHWKDGAVTDEQPASDADLDTVRALILASERFGDRSLVREARRISLAIGGQETATYGDRMVVVAGPWARDGGVINPSYLSPRTFVLLGAQTGDRRWDRLAAGSTAVLSDLMSGGRLPPDWAQMQPDGSVRPTGPPGTDRPPAYDVEAPRVLLRLAESCTPADRELAATVARPARQHAAQAASPVAMVAAAAATLAAGDEPQALRLLDRAESMVDAQPTYYGWALVALARVMLTSDALGTCG